MRLMNAFGDAAEHVVLSGMPDQLSARDAIGSGIMAAFPEDTPSLTGRFGLPRLFQLSRYMRGFDLALSYNWGACDAVMARYLFGGPPLIHHEDGFNQDEAGGLKPARNLYRRLGLSGAHRLVVPSHRLEDIARKTWAQPEQRIVRIGNGVPVALFAGSPEPGAIPGFNRRPGEIVVGTVAGLRVVKNLPRLVRAFAAAELPNARLVIVGEGPEAERIARDAAARGVADRVLLPGFLRYPARWIGHFDIFALSSDSEQAPISLIEAMAAGLPVAATNVGDVAAMVSEDNRPLIVDPDDEAGLAAALRTLAERQDLRRAIGEANREKARADHDERTMIRRYAQLYGEAIGRPQAFMAAIG